MFTFLYVNIYNYIHVHSCPLNRIVIENHIAEMSQKKMYLNILLFYRETKSPFHLFLRIKYQCTTLLANVKLKYLIMVNSLYLNVSTRLAKTHVSLHLVNLSYLTSSLFKCIFFYDLILPFGVRKTIFWLNLITF